MLALCQQRASVQLRGTLQIAGDYSGFTKFNGGERREEKGARQKGKAINKFWGERRRNWLSYPFLLIRPWFVFWLARAVLRMGGIRGICWWMKSLRCCYMKDGRMKRNPINKPIYFLTNEWSLNRKTVTFLVTWEDQHHFHFCLLRYGDTCQQQVS